MTPYTQSKVIDVDSSAEGNQTKKVRIADGLTWTFGYDHRNQMAFAERRTTDCGALQERIDYKYDVFGGLIERVSTLTGTERRAYDRMTVWADLDSGNNITARRMFGAGEEPVARITVGGAVAVWYLLDRQGSVRDMTDNTGAIQYTATYGGFGNIEAVINEIFGDRYAYATGERDQATGFQLHWWRWYDPASGRWTSQDPIRFHGGNANLYGYVGNGPTNGIDSSGLFDEALFWENVEKLAPDVKKWFQNELGGKVVQREWGVFRWNVTGTWKTTDAGTEKIMYISSHYDEIEAAKQFIEYATTGYWFASDWNAKDLDKPELPGSHEKWREWYAKEVKRVGQIGLDVMKGYYSIALKGADWVITVNDIVEGEASFETYLKLLSVVRVMPRAKNTAFRVVDKTGRELVKLKSDDLAELVKRGANVAKRATTFDEFKVGRTFAQGEREAQRAWRAYREAGQAKKGLVIGHGDTPIEAASGGWQAFRMGEKDVKYSEAINKAWIDGAVDAGLPIRLVTPWEKIRKPSVTWSEIQWAISRGGRIVAE